MAHAATRPVETLRSHAALLEAQLAVCLQNLGQKPVHKLRTETRRIEAQLLLLERMHGLPPFHKEAASVRKHLKKLRRAAGYVRDLDVQCKLLQGDEMLLDSRRSLRAMAKLRRQRRDEAADELLEQLRRRQAKLAKALKALLEALEPAAHLELPADELLAIADRCFRKNLELEVHKPTTEQLHMLRKTAKVARYLAESAPDSRQAKQAAKRYESLQQAGGEWHDWMELAEGAREELGRHHPLAEDFKRRCHGHLDQFQELLHPLRKNRKKPSHILPA
jgi:CHAD domain-containing protein